ncbi:MAG: thymidine kinase [Clostridium sp.]|nr:MAG: thymidine kinase [Clostridium sp.]
MEYNKDKAGTIEVICGPMFAGKTEELIRRVKRMQFAKKEFVVFKPQIDDRYSVDEVVSHSHLKFKAINISKPNEMLKYIKSTTQAIVIDEVQFFDESILDIIDSLANNGLRVICAGLDCDFRGKPFGIIPSLLAMAEHITKLTAICACCGEDATCTQRIINGRPAFYDDPIILVGATESYEPRCRRCHEVLHHE